MYSKSVIAPSLIQAYTETEYMVYGDSPMTLKVGKSNPELAELYKIYAVDCSVFITAWNPISRVADDQLNNFRQAILKHDLLAQGLIFIDGIGQPPSGSWTSEQSFLVLGVSLEAAKNLGTHYQQNAIIWCNSEALPQLILLR